MIAERITVLETIEYVVKETDVWIEQTTLLIPGENDSPDEIDRMPRWVVEHLGPDVPMHFTAFFPAFRMLDVPPTPHQTLNQARQIAMQNGVRYAYVGNVDDEERSSTYCSSCGAVVIGRSQYDITEWHLDEPGTCRNCGATCAGSFERSPGSWGSRRMPLRPRGLAFDA